MHPTGEQGRTAPSASSRLTQRPHPAFTATVYPPCLPGPAPDGTLLTWILPSRLPAAQDIRVFVAGPIPILQDGLFLSFWTEDLGCARRYSAYLEQAAAKTHEQRQPGSRDDPRAGLNPVSLRRPACASAAMGLEHSRDHRLPPGRIVCKPFPVPPVVAECSRHEVGRCVGEERESAQRPRRHRPPGPFQQLSQVVGAGDVAECPTARDGISGSAGLAQAKQGELTMRMELATELLEKRGHGDELKKLLRRGSE